MTAAGTTAKAVFMAFSVPCASGGHQIDVDRNVGLVSPPARRRRRPMRPSGRASGARLPSMLCRARAASSTSLNTELVAGQRVLRGEPGAEQERVVGPERDGDPGVDDGPERDLRRVGVDPQRDVAARADLEGHARLGHPVQRRRVLARPHPVADPVGPEHGERVDHRRRPEQLAAVGDERESAVPGDLERRREVRQRPSPLVVREAEPDHGARAVTGIPDGEAREGAGVEGVPDPAGRDDDTDPRPGRPGGLRRLVEDDLEGGGDATDVRGVRRRLDLQLEPPRALGGVVLGRLTHDPAQVGLPADAGPGQVVEPLEPEPAALVRGVQLRRPLVGERLGQGYAALLRQVGKRADPHRPGEVQVQVRLGERRDVAGRRVGLAHSSVGASESSSFIGSSFSIRYAVASVSPSSSPSSSVPKLDVVVAGLVGGDVHGRLLGGGDPAVEAHVLGDFVLLAGPPRTLRRAPRAGRPDGRRPRRSRRPPGWRPGRRRRACRCRRPGRSRCRARRRRSPGRGSPA